MAQFDVFTNPIGPARRAYPLVVVLQSDLADTGRDRIVAPLVPRSRLPATAGRMTPHVEVEDTEYIVVVPALAAMLSNDLRQPHGKLTKYRDALVAALDYLFLGV